jgi:hypothetical protein
VRVFNFDPRTNPHIHTPCTHKLSLRSRVTRKHFQDRHKIFIRKIRILATNQPADITPRQPGPPGQLSLIQAALLCFPLQCHSEITHDYRQVLLGRPVRLGLFFDRRVAVYATNQISQQQQSAKRQGKIMYSNQNQNPAQSSIALATEDQFSQLPPVQNSDQIRVNSRPFAVSSSPFHLRQDLGFWVLSSGDDQAILKHEIGLSYVAYLMDHPNEPIHGLALALKIRAQRNGQPADSAELIQERALALDDAEAARRLFLKQQELEGVIDDPMQIDPVKEEASRQLLEIYEYQNKNPWRTRDNAQRCVRAVTMSLKRLHRRLAKASDAQGNPHPVFQPFAKHIFSHILIPSGRGAGHGGIRPHQSLAGSFIYQPPVS